MHTIQNKIIKNSFFFVLSLIIAIAFPIALKNNYSCLVGVCFAVFFLYQIVLYGVTLAKDNYFVVVAKCIDKKKSTFGSMTSGEEVFFEPVKTNKEIKNLENITEPFSLMLATSYNPILKSKNSKNSDTVIGLTYEIVFEKKTDKNNNIIYDNRNFLGFSTFFENKA